MHDFLHRKPTLLGMPEIERYAASAERLPYCVPALGTAAYRDDSDYSKDGPACLAVWWLALLVADIPAEIAEVPA